MPRGSPFARPRPQPATLALAVLLLLPLSGPGAGRQVQLSPEDRAWNRRHPEAGDYVTVLEVSGRGELARFVHRPADPHDLSGPCEARREAVDGAIPATQVLLASLEAASPGVRDLRDIAFTHHALGQLWSHEGAMDRAVAHFEAAYRIATEHPEAHPGFGEAARYLLAVLGVAQLRRGELENCVHDHRAASCIFPISEEARHGRPSGSANAIARFEEHLARQPDNLEVRWLLNVAYMTLGKYPDEVPSAHLIPPERFAAAEDSGRFVDVAAAAGLDRFGRAGGVIVDDFFNDGLLDVVISSVDPCEPLRLYRNQGDGTFRDVTIQAGLSRQLGGINIVQADYDNDGWLDIFVMRGGWEYPMRNSLLRNNGNGTFTDVTVEAGLTGTVHRTHSAAWADFDNDGWLDLFVGNEESPDNLFRNQGDGTFIDVASDAGVAGTAFTKGVAWGDVDDDGSPDLYVSNYAGENFLYRNNRDGTFTEMAAAAGVAKPIMSFPTWFWDYDNDGRLDLFVASFVPSLTEVVRGFLGLPRQAETMKLYRNAGEGRFEDVTEAVGLDRVVPTMGANFGDIDNDGFLDIYLGTGAPSYAAIMPNFLFRNAGGRRFADVTSTSGTGHLQKGHGVAFADFDGSGALDIFSNIGGFVPGDAYTSVLFRNPGSENRWIRVRLVGVKTNRSAIGAKISVYLGRGFNAEDAMVGTAVAQGLPPPPKASARSRRSSLHSHRQRTKADSPASPGDPRMIHRHVSSGGSFGASPLMQHIGLGKAERIERLEIFWPASRTRQVFESVGVNQEIEITEFKEDYRVLSR